jgi:flagellar motor switch protein FliN
MPTITPGTRLHSFADAFCEATKKVFSQALGANWEVEIDTTEAAPSAETSVVCFQLSASGALQGNALIQLQSVDALAVAQKFVGETQDPSISPNQDHKDALEELLRQVAGLAAVKLGSLFGETKLEVKHMEPTSSAGVNFTLLASQASSSKLMLELGLSPELMASLSSISAAAAVPVADLQVSNLAVSHEPNFDLLLGVNLNLTLRFGQRTLPLREVLELASGSVIELDHEVHEPADLLLGDKVIARGHVVIVDGNYGVRITEVADARQRIGTL